MEFFLERIREIGYPALILLVLGVILALCARPFWEKKGFEGDRLTQYVLYTKLAALVLVIASVLLGVVF